jgi:hypothetical protein
MTSIEGFAGSGAAFNDLRTGIDAHVSGRGMVVRAGALSWSLGLRALGRGVRLEPVGAAAPAARANQVTLRHPGAIDELYDYGPLGLEQGFMLGGGRPAAPGR